MVLQLLRLLLARQHAVFAGDDYNSERPTVEQLLMQVLPLLLPLQLHMHMLVYGLGVWSRTPL